MLAPSAAIFSLVLIITGAAKIARPNDVSRALLALGMPRIPGVGLGIGVFEVLIGVGSLVAPPLLLAQAALYVAFAAWVSVALRADAPIASCGCLGKADTPPTVAHVLIDLLASALSLGAFFGTPLALAFDVEAAAAILVMGAGVFLCYVILTDGARLVGARRR